jgi:hypothetical protein
MVAVLRACFADEQAGLAGVVNARLVFISVFCVLQSICSPAKMSWDWRSAAERSAVPKGMID